MFETLLSPVDRSVPILKDPGSDNQLVEVGCSSLLSIKHDYISYRFVKMWNGDQLPEQVYQPLGLQNDCAVVLNNHPQVMIEI